MLNSLDVTMNHFETEEEALNEAKSLGLYAFTQNVPSSTDFPHWHDFDLVFYILEGTMQITECDTGVVHQCTPGCRIKLPSFIAHSELHDEYRAVVGLSMSPDTLTQPVAKPLPVQRKN